MNIFLRTLSAVIKLNTCQPTLLLCKIYWNRERIEERRVNNAQVAIHNYTQGTGNNEYIQDTGLGGLTSSHSSLKIRSPPVKGLDSVEAGRRERSNVHQYVSLCSRDVWQLSIGADRKEESSVLSQRKETAHCVNDKLERGTRTAGFNADIRSLRGGAAARDTTDPVVLSWDVGELV